MLHKPNAKGLEKPSCADSQQMTHGSRSLFHFFRDPIDSARFLVVILLIIVGYTLFCDGVSVFFPPNATVWVSENESGIHYWGSLEQYKAEEGSYLYQQFPGTIRAVKYQTGSRIQSLGLAARDIVFLLFLSRLLRQLIRLKASIADANN
jgi:hypothetical protein